ncbi:MAG: glycine cleavage system protein GcvH [Phycisphaerae bacterium]
MTNVPDELLYTEQHEWAKVEGDTVTVGISDHAQEQLGDITFVELPEVGDKLTAGGEACALESTKAAASIYAPADGEVAEVNEALEDDPAAVNSDPYGAGWIYKMKVSDSSQLDKLMKPDDYRKMLESSE